MKNRIKEGISIIENFLNPPGKPTTSFIKIFLLLRQLNPDIPSLPLYNYVVQYLHNIYNEFLQPFEDMDSLNHRILEVWYRYIGFVPREGEQDLEYIPEIVNQRYEYTPIDEFLTSGFNDENHNEQDQYIRNQIPSESEVENLRNYLEFSDDISELSTELDSLSHSRLDDNVIEPQHVQTIYIYKKKIFTDKKKLEFEKLKNEKQRESRVVVSFIPSREQVIFLKKPEKINKKSAVQTIKLEHKKNLLKKKVGTKVQIIDLKHKENLLKSKTGNIVSTIRLNVKKNLKRIYGDKFDKMLANNQLNSTELRVMSNTSNSVNSTALVLNNTNSNNIGNLDNLGQQFNKTEFLANFDDMEIEDEDVIDLDENLNRLEAVKENENKMEEEEELDNYDEEYYRLHPFKKDSGKYINKLNRTAIADLIKENPEYQYPITYFYEKYNRFTNETQNKMMEQINLYMEKYGIDDDPYMSHFINMQKLADMGDWDLMELHYEEFTVNDNLGNKISRSFSYLWQRLVDFSKLVVMGFVENVFKYDNWVKMAVITLSLGGFDFNSLGLFGQGLRAYNHISRFVMPMARFRNYMQNRNSIGHIMLNELRNYQLDRQFNFVFQNPANFIVQNQYVPPLRAFYTPGNLIQHVGNELVNYDPNFNRPYGNQLMQDMANVQLMYQRQYFNRAKQALDMYKNEDRLKRKIQDNISNYNNKNYRDDSGFVYENYDMHDLRYVSRQDFYSSTAFINNGRWQLNNLLKRIGKRILFGNNQGQ